MEIKTKLSIGDDVYYMCNDRIFCSPVKSIKTDSGFNLENEEDDVRIETLIIYHLDNSSHVKENEAFSTIDELLEYLKSSFDDLPF